jgi:FAD/FMN-containing dehydrogenase
MRLTGLRPIARSQWLSSCRRVSSRRAVLTYCDENNVKVVARGAGTSLSGGTLPLEHGVLVSMMKFNKINEPMKVAAPSDNPSRLRTHTER